MIFVTVGTQKFQFNRLFKEIDRLISSKDIEEEVVAQIGYTTYKTTNIKSFELLSEEILEEYIERASLVITHSGTSSIMKCLKRDKKVLVVPRMAQFKEHVDDHQLELAKVYEEKNIVEVVYDINDLKEKMKICKSKQYDELILDNSVLLGSIKNYINSL